MKLKCTGVINGYNDCFVKGDEYEFEELKSGELLIYGNREKFRGGGFMAVKSLGKWVVLGIAKFEAKE